MERFTYKTESIDALKRSANASEQVSNIIRDKLLCKSVSNIASKRYLALRAGRNKER